MITTAGTNQWTVLFYLAGKNDLECDLYRQFQGIQNLVVPDNINIVIQFGKGPKDNTITQDGSEQWDGARRYISNNGSLVLIESLGDLNMGKTESFIEFLFWGYSQFAADHLMLIMSGHSAGFVGIMMECHNDNLDLISIQDFAQALANFQKQTGKNIDILLFDTCYMNMVEIWYELAVTAGKSVEYLIVPQENPPLQGLPCQDMINLLIGNQQASRIVKESVKNIVLSINRKFSCDNAIFAVSLAQEYFVALKELIDSLAMLELDSNVLFELPGVYSKPSALISLPDLLDQWNVGIAKADACCKGLKNTLDQIVLYPKLSNFERNKNVGPCIYLPNDQAQYYKFQSYYDKLSFASNNRWLKVLQRKRATSSR